MILDVAATVCIGLLTGVEFAVSAFVNPVLWKLEPAAQAAAIRSFARLLGGVMPFWYGGCLLLLGIEAALRFRQPGFYLLIGAVAVWIAVIVLTLLFLVPINNRLAKMGTQDLSDAAAREHRQWDGRHRLRVAALIGAFVCLLLAVH